MDRNHGGGRDEQNLQFLGGYCQDGQNWGISVEDYPLEPLDSICIRMSQDNQGLAGTVQPQGTSDELKSLDGFHLQSWNFGNQSVARTKQPGRQQGLFTALRKDWLNFTKKGLVKRCAKVTKRLWRPLLIPQLYLSLLWSSDDFLTAPFWSLNNGIQTLSSYGKELNVQQFDQLPADTLGIQQLWMTQLGQPGVLNSIDQVSLLPVSGTQLPESQMPAAIQPLIQQQFDQAAATANSCSTRTIGESNISEAEWKRLVRKRECDRQYRTREKVKKQKLVVEHEEFRAQNAELCAQIEVLNNVVLKLEHKTKSNHLKLKSCELKITKLEAENEDLKEKNLLLKGRFENAMRLHEEMKSMEKQIAKQGINKPKRKLKKQVMMAETAKETKNDN